MRALFVASEVVPFAKVGGLADVTGALPVELEKLGLEIAVILPFYHCVRSNAERLSLTDMSVSVELGGQLRTARIWKSNLPGSNAPVFLIEQDDLYDREGIYNSSRGAYKDNNARFIFFNKAALELVRVLGVDFDVIHANDWMTGLIPVYLRTIYANDPHFKGTSSVFTIHNLAHKGLLSPGAVKLTGLAGCPEIQRMMINGRVSLLKGAIVYSDVITTVSRRYAKEIQTAEFGEGLEELLRSRSDDLFGILNGIDYSVWNPETDRLIPVDYSARDLSGKAACKAALQRDSGLPVREAVPLFGIVCRLCEQKGLDILMKALEDFLALGVQLILLGAGGHVYERFFKKAAERHPDQMAVTIGFDEALAHRIEAGADIFLMPSKFEPCGLNQMISLKYGTVPIVRRTGGLADTIMQCSGESVKDANGFSFDSQLESDFLACAMQAILRYRNPEDWKCLVLNGMSQDWSWKKSAVAYVSLYEHAGSCKYTAMGQVNEHARENSSLRDGGRQGVEA
ncbi:MAG: glycogen synthase GlgA [Chloroflexi bacterium]|nr:glycogen synthase GlgA [Chloroflexota bacterium]